MPAYILACDQVAIPSTLVASDGAVSMTCASGTVSIIQHVPTIFVPLSLADSMLVTAAVATLWGAAWLMRLLSNFISERYQNHEI